MKNSLIIAALTLLIALSGCTANNESPRQQVNGKWNNARAGVLYGLARQQVGSGNLSDARKSLDEAIRLQPENVPIRLLSSRVRIEQAQLDAAVQELTALLEKDPKNAEAAYLMGIVYQRWEKPQEALEWYVLASDSSTSEPAYALARAEMLVALGESKQALDYLQDKMAYFETSAPIRDAVGQILVAQGQYTRALPILRQAMILSQEDAAPTEHYAMALYYAGSFRESLSLLEKINSSRGETARADLVLAQAQCLLALDHPRDARDILQDLAIKFPSNASVWIALSQSHLACDDADRSDAALAKALALDGSYIQAILMRGYIRINQGRLDDALAAFARAADLDRNDPMPLTLQGYVMELMGDNEKAMEMYGKALRIRPSDVLASQLMANAMP